MALKATAMMTLATLKNYLSIPGSDVDYDSELEGAIDAVSDGFARYCNRDTFVSSAIVEYPEGHDDDTIWLKNTPISETTSSVIIWMDTDRLYPDSTKLTRTDYAVFLDTGKVVLIDDVFLSNPLALKASYCGGYTTVPSDLLMVAKEECQRIWKRKVGGVVGLSSSSVAQGGSTSYEEVDEESGYLKSTTAVLRRYRRW